MKTKFIILFTFILTLSFNSAFAQGCEGDPAPATGGDGTPKTSSITVFGFIQPQYNVFFTDPAENTFLFKRARVGVRGRANRSFSYYVVLETAALLGSGDAFLLDAFVSYDKHEWIKVSLGQFKQPFSREVGTACHSLTTIERSVVADQLVVPQRDLGVMLLGGSSKTKFKYAAALMNGYGINAKDNNKSKDLIGRVSYQAFDFLNIGANYRYGVPLSDEDNPSNDIDNDNIRTTWGVDAQVVYKDLTVSAEYIYDQGAYNTAATGGCGGAPLDLDFDGRDGAYIMASYNVTDKLQPVLKWEYFDADKSQKTLGYQETLTFGVNYFFSKMVRIQVNYLAKTINGITENNDALLMQAQIRF